jgi:hypothetical protein
MATPPPPPRLCHLVKLPTFEGFGFNLYAEKKKPGQYIGEIDSDSPAEAAGLKEGDRIIEVNGVNVNMENHRQVVQRIKAVAGETRLLVVDQKSADWHRDHRVLVKASLPYVIHLSSEKADKSDRDGTERPSADHNEVFEEVTAIDSSPQTSSRSASVCSLPSVEVGEQFKTEISISVTFSDEGSEDLPQMSPESAEQREKGNRVMSDCPATDVDVVTAGHDEKIFTAEKVETDVSPRLPSSSGIEKEEEAERKFEDVEIDESEAYAAFFSNDRVAEGENNGQDDTGLRPPKQEEVEEVTIIETNGPATGVDVVLTQPDLEKESVAGETKEENSVTSEQVSFDETVEDLSHLEVVTNEEILMVEEAAKKEEEERGSDKQESEEDEMDDPPASPPVSDSSSISIPPSPIPKEVLGSRGSSIRSSPSPSHSPLGPATLNLSMTAKEMRNMLASRRKKDPRIDDRMDFRRKHEIIQTL